MNRRFLLRLIQEWEQYGKIIIAVDFDDTISPFRYNDVEAQRSHLQTKRVDYPSSLGF